MELWLNKFSIEIELPGHDYLRMTKNLCYGHDCLLLKWYDKQDIIFLSLICFSACYFVFMKQK